MSSRSILAICVLAALTVPASAPALVRGAAANDAYTLSAEALLGPDQTDLYLSVNGGAAPPAELGLVQVKVFAEDGRHVRTETFHQVASPEGRAAVVLRDLARKQVLEVKAHAKDGDQNNIEAEATVLRRPDLVVRAEFPRRVVRTRPFTVPVEIEEIGGDTGANATISFADGGTTIASSPVTVAAGEKVTLAVQARLNGIARHDVSTTVGAVAPGDANSSNNAAAGAVNVARYSVDGAVTSDEPYATEIGRDILKAGGNAVDAAVAMQFVLGVTQPQNVGLGGGATVVLHMEGKGDFALDARELSPADTTPDQLWRIRPSDGAAVLKTNATSSGFVVGVPGSLKLAELMLQRWGTTTLAQSLEQATALAAGGFKVGRNLAENTVPGRRCQNVGQPETKALYCNGPGLPEGSTHANPDLAKTYRMIAEQGTGVFYNGEIADAIVEATKRNRVPAAEGSGVGKMTRADIAAYTIDESPPIAVDYAGHRLLSVGGSSAGGYIALDVLRMLELRRGDFTFGSGAFGWMSPSTAHVMTEAMGLAFADHFYWMGGGQVPRQGLLSDCYLGPRAALIKLDQRIRRPPRPIGDPQSCNAAVESATAGPTDESSDGLTSHFSVVDKWGNAVSFTTTLTDAWGSGILVPGYGFVLNDAMSNFNVPAVAKPGAFPSPGDPGMNDSGPTKRARGYTAPLIAMKGDEVALVTGSPGGFAIPSVVVNVVMNALDFGMPIQQAVDASRMWWNMTTFIWNANPAGTPIPPETIDYLKRVGNLFQGPLGPPQVGGAQSISVDPTFEVGAAQDRLIPDSTAAMYVE